MELHEPPIQECVAKKNRRKKKRANQPMAKNAHIMEYRKRQGKTSNRKEFNTLSEFL